MGMTDETENALAIAALRGNLDTQEERMNTIKAEYRTNIAGLAEDMAQRETRLILAMAGMIGLAVAILKFV